MTTYIIITSFLSLYALIFVIQKLTSPSRPLYIRDLNHSQIESMVQKAIEVINNEKEYAKQSIRLQYCFRKSFFGIFNQVLLTLVLGCALLCLWNNM